MQWLTLVPEDAGLQRLKADNRVPATTPSVNPVAPYPVVHPVHPDRRQESARAYHRDRRHAERRQGERRQKQVPVILDTRCKHDRRGLENRRETVSEPATKAAGTRVDIYA